MGVGFRAAGVGVGFRAAGVGVGLRVGFPVAGFCTLDVEAEIPEEGAESFFCGGFFLFFTGLGFFLRLGLSDLSGVGKGKSKFPKFQIGF